jgi:hypothetical protein
MDRKVVGHDAARSAPSLPLGTRCVLHQANDLGGVTVH